MRKIARLLEFLQVPVYKFVEREGILPEELCGFRPQRSTVDMTFVV